MDLVVGWSFVVMVAVAAAFPFAGERLFEKLPTVRRFLELSDKLEATVVTGARFGRGQVTVGQAVSIPLFKLSPLPPTNLHGFSTRQFGDAVDIIHTRARRHRTMIKELTGYCILLLGLFGIGFARAQSDSGYQLTLMSTVREIGAKPFEFVGLFEVIMIFFFALRLALELLDLREMVGKH